MRGRSAGGIPIADGGSFCSNLACHGRKWPGMTLDPQAKKQRRG